MSKHYPPASHSKAQEKAALIKMCYEDPRMVENLPNFYRRLANVRDINNKAMFESYELDQIVIAA
jgi:hypothetical protein